MYKNCMVVGKFWPPHKGHEYLIRFAQNYAQNVHVIVDSFAHQTISPEKRKEWLEEEIKGIQVYALKENMPQDPSDTPEFWPIWKKAIIDTLGFKPDVVIAAMDYGWELARVLECDFVPADIARQSLPVSATMLRTDIFKHWDYLLDSAKPHFIKKICLLGPESTGKSTSAKNLAQALNTIYVPEYAQMLIEKQNGKFFFENVNQTAYAQVSSEKSLAKFTNKIMICDSCAITTKVFSKMLFNASTDLLEDTIKNHAYDLYVLFYPDTHWVDDTHRQVLTNPQAQRIKMFEQFEFELKSINANYVVLKGSYEEKDELLLELANKMINCE